MAVYLDKEAANPVFTVIKEPSDATERITFSLKDIDGMGLQTTLVSTVKVVRIASYTNTGLEKVVSNIVIVIIKIPFVIKGTERTVELKDTDPFN